MDDSRFDALAKSLAAASNTRRQAVATGIVSIVLPAVALVTGRAKKKHKHKKKKCAKAGQGTSKKRKKCCQGLAKDENGRCAASCAQRGCAAGQICLSSGDCLPCTVTCTGTPAECGVALQTAIDAGGTVYVCPGRYQGSFTLNNSVSVIGAGEGADAVSDTILDAAGAFSVLEIGGTGQVEIARLGITGGAGSAIRHMGTRLGMTDCTVSSNGGLNAFGAGISSDRTLELTRCTIRDNHATGQYGAGAALAISGGTATLTDCLVEANDATTGAGFWISGGKTTLAGTLVRGNIAYTGGGFYFAGGTLAIAEDCRVTENVAPSGHGGGIYLTAGDVALFGPDPSPIVVNNCHENCFPVGDVPKCVETQVSC